MGEFGFTARTNAQLPRPAATFTPSTDTLTSDAELRIFGAGTKTA
jgi:hypothetical protein